MTLLVPQTGEISGPYPSELSQPYWDGCARGELRFQRCASCGLATHTPALICAHCTSRELAWEASAGTGSVYSWTTVWRPQTPAFVVPYQPIIVDVDEGFQMLSNLVGCEHDAVHIGMRITVEFHTIADGTMLPYFRPKV
ncbi:MAG: OB-fold domain-containing protein [Acidimicrobiia bacterium]